jgi:ABC-2 type transport system permease protein
MNTAEQVKRSLAIVKKDLAIYYMKGPVIIFGLLLPAFLFISFALGKDLPIEFLFPGLLGMAIFFTSTSIGPAIAPTETATRTLERIVSAPISLWAIILGDVLASFLFGLIITSFVFLLGIALLGTGFITLSLVVGTVIASFCFSAFGLVLSAPPTDKPSNIMMLSSLIKFPLIFISGVFIPLSQMPGASKFISFVSPLTYYTDLARHSIEGNSYFSPALNLLALSGFAVLFFVVAVTWHKKSLTKRF